jgi:hypothetical protein
MGHNYTVNKFLTILAKDIFMFWVLINNTNFMDIPKVRENWDLVH